MHSFLGHMHVLQIIDDHQAMWLEALTDNERSEIRARLYKQLGFAGLNFVGLEVSIHGAVAAIATDPLHGASLILIGFALMWATNGKG